MMGLHKNSMEKNSIANWVICSFYFTKNLQEKSNRFIKAYCSEQPILGFPALK